MILRETLWFYEKRYDFTRNSMILRETLWFYEKRYDFTRIIFGQKYPDVFFKKKERKENWHFSKLAPHSFENTLSTHSFSPFFLSKQNQTRTGNRTRHRKWQRKWHRKSHKDKKRYGFFVFFLFYKYTLSFLFFISSSKYCVDVFTFMSDWIWKLSENVDRFLGFWRGTVENCSIGFYEKR